MATAAPTVSSTKETTNYARLCRLLVDIGTQVLRDTFDAIHPPANLHAVLAANIATLQSLRSRKFINQIQWGKLFPAIPTSVSSHAFDTTLLMVLLRNVCRLTPPRTGWCALPTVTDLSCEADMVRVKYFRNTVYGHAETASVDDVKFNDYWRDIRDTLIRLGGVGYKAAIDDLRNECMDPEVQDHYRELLSQWKKDEENIKEELGEIKKILHVLARASSKETTDQGESKTRKDSKSGIDMCDYHENEVLEYYCQECKVCICHICGQIRHDHHTTIDIQQAAEKHKVPMMKILYEAKANVDVIESEINKQIELRNKSKGRIIAAQNKVTETVKELIQVLKDHEKTAKEELAQIDKTEEKDHEAQLKKFKMFATELKCLIGRGEDIFQRSIALEILQEERVVFGGCEELLSECQKMKIHKPGDVNYVVDRGNLASLRQLVQLPLGQVVVSDHSQSAAEGKGLKEAELGATTTFTVTTRDSQGKQFYSEQEHVTVSISSRKGDEEVQIRDCKDGKYIVHYKPKTVGRHDVKIEVNGWPLAGSPWSVNVTPHHYKLVTSYGSPGKGQGEFDFPCSIAKNERTGNIAVADNHNRRIQMFDKDWKYVRTIAVVTGSQTSAVKISRPWSVAFSWNGDMIVIHGDEHSRQMSAITDRGQFIEQFSEHLINPFSVFVKNDGDGHVIVCDQGDKKIKVLSPDGADVLQSFSAPNLKKSPLFAFHHRDMFFVSYCIADCVKVFNKEGEFLYDIGSKGSGEGQLSRPMALAVHAFDHLIVCNTGNWALKVFTLDGKFLCLIDEGIEKPWFVTVCKNGDLLVADSGRQCIHVLR